MRESLNCLLKLSSFCTKITFDLQNNKNSQKLFVDPLLMFLMGYFHANCFVNRFLNLTTSPKQLSAGPFKKDNIAPEVASIWAIYRTKTSLRVKKGW